MRRTFIVFALSALFAGCATRPSSSTARVTKHHDGRYEIRLDAKEWVAGGPCGIAWPHRVPASDWIYVSALHGEVPSPRLVLTHYQGKTKYPWNQQRLRGSVMFWDNRMRVAFEIPAYDGNRIDHYEPYELNGSYRLQFE